MELLTMVIIGVFVLITICLFAWYTVVPPSQAHLVNPGKKIFTNDKKVMEQVLKNKDDSGVQYGGGWYFKIPIIRNIRILDLVIMDITEMMETFEKDQGRYGVRFSIKFRINNVERAAETFTSNEALFDQLKENFTAAVRVVTVAYGVNDARAMKSEMEEKIRSHVGGDLEAWGLELVNFVLVDFHDTKDSAIISDISRRREVGINSQTRQENAQRIQEARVKEAEAEQIAKKREIEKEEAIAMRDQDKLQAVAVKAKDTREKELDIVKVQQVKTAEINKEKAVIEATQQKEVESINKDQKFLIGEGDKLRDIEQAEGKAAYIKAQGLAEAAAKEALQEALNKFKDEAIRALIAEKVVAMQQAIGVATAEAIGKSDVKIFSGGGNAQAGFDLGSLVSAAQLTSDAAAQTVINRIARPNDLGLSALGIKSIEENTSKKGE